MGALVAHRRLIAAFLVGPLQPSDSRTLWMQNHVLETRDKNITMSSYFGIECLILDTLGSKLSRTMLTKPFITSNPPDARILFENFGLTFYYAQLLEDDLKLILVAGEMLGLFSFDRQKRLKIKNTDDDLIGACMGALKEVIKANRKPNDDDTFYNLLDDANAARRLIAHRFFLEHAVDLLSESGREAVNQHLSKLYLTIRQAHTFSSALRERIYSEMGFTPEMVQQKLAELYRIINAPDGDA